MDNNYLPLSAEVIPMLNLQGYTQRKIETLHNETLIWKSLYREIDNSDHPETHFTEQSMVNISESELIVSNFEIKAKGLERDTRIAIAKLRTAIDNVLMIERQLRPMKKVDYQAKATIGEKLAC